MKRSLVFLFLSTHLGLCGDPQNPAPPPDPQVAHLPGSVSFIKSFAYPNEEKPKKKSLKQFHSQFPQLVRLEVVRTGQTQKEVESYTDGTVTEKWKSGQITLFASSSMPDQIMATSSGMEAHEEATPGDPVQDIFPELAWVNSGSFKKEQLRQGVKCLLYKADDQTAWLSQETRLPVFFQNSKMQVSYLFQTPPDEPLQLPEKFEKKLEAVKRAWSGRNN